MMTMPHHTVDESSERVICKNTLNINILKLHVFINGSNIFEIVAQVENDLCSLQIVYRLHTVSYTHLDVYKRQE